MEQTTYATYKTAYKRIVHLADDKMKELHKFLSVETENFTDWYEVQSNPDLDSPAKWQFKAVDKILKAVATDPGYSGHQTKGRNYEATKNLGIVEIAKLVREELKISFPDCQISVTTDKYSGGQSLHVQVKAIDFDPIHPQLRKALNDGMTYRQYQAQPLSNETGVYREWPVFNAAHAAFMEKLKAVYEQYNRDDSDSQQDYFSTKFYGSAYSINVEDYLASEADPKHKDKQKLDTKAQNAKTKAEAAAREKARIEQFGNFKKGELAYYKIGYDSKRGHWKKGDLILCKILVVPNGRGDARFSYYKVATYFPEGGPGIGSLQKPTLVHNGINYYYWHEYSQGTKADILPLSAGDKKKAKPAKNDARRQSLVIKKSARRVRSGAIARKSAKRVASADSKLPAVTAPKRSRESVVETLTAVRAQVKRSKVLDQKIRSRKKTKSDAATKTRTAPKVTATPVKPKTAGKPRKAAKTPKNVLKRIDRLQATVKSQQQELRKDERLIKKIHKQTQR